MVMSLNNVNVKCHTRKIIFVDRSSIFQFLNPNGNERLAQLSSSDLHDFLSLLDEYYLTLRHRLGLEQSVTFGLELEVEQANKTKIKRLLSEMFSDGAWQTKSDASLFDGIEIVSPILRDSITAWRDLNSVCASTKPLATIGASSGGHIHIGVQTLGGAKESWLNFIKLWSIYEPVIFRFAYGEFLTSRFGICDYARPMAKWFWNDYEMLKQEDASIEDILFLRMEEMLRLTLVTCYGGIITCF